MSIKKFKFKYITLGLALAGCMSGSAFALVATSNSTIRGNAPVLKSLANTEKGLTVSTSVNEGEALKVGDTITVKYRFSDSDGDKETAAGGTAESFVFYYKVGTEWKTIAPTTKVPDTKTDGTGEGSVTLVITHDMLGATAIGALVQQASQYGAPRFNTGLLINNIFSKDTAPKPVNPTNPVDPTKPEGGGNGPSVVDPGDLETGGGNSGGEVINPPNFPGSPIQPSADYAIGIFKQGDYTVNYAASDTLLSIGSTYEVVVWKDTDGNKLPTAGEPIATTSYNFNWSLMGDGAAAGGGASASLPAAGVSVASSGTTYAVGLNSAYAEVTGLKDVAVAGAQGYKLSVKGTLK